MRLSTVIAATGVAFSTSIATQNQEIPEQPLLGTYNSESRVPTPSQEVNPIYAIMPRVLEVRVQKRKAADFSDRYSWKHSVQSYKPQPRFNRHKG